MYIPVETLFLEKLFFFFFAVLGIQFLLTITGGTQAAKG